MEASKVALLHRPPPFVRTSNAHPLRALRRWFRGRTTRPGAPGRQHTGCPRHPPLRSSVLAPDWSVVRRSALLLAPALSPEGLSCRTMMNTREAGAHNRRRPVREALVRGMERGANGEEGQRGRQRGPFSSWYPFLWGGGGSSHDKSCRGFAH